MSEPIDCPQALRDALHLAGLDSVEGAFEYGGGTDLVKGKLGHRRRTKLMLTDSTGRVHELFLKRYGREPFTWRLRRRWTYGRSGGPARVEFENILAAARAGIATMQGIAVGEENDSRGGFERGYIVVSKVPGEALSRSLESFRDRHAADGAMEAMTEALAKLVAALHNSGHVHRDLYTAHIFLDESFPSRDREGADQPTILCQVAGPLTNARGSDGIALYLIDLARMFRPRWRRLRWIVKDLAQLHFSMPDWWRTGQWAAFFAKYLELTHQQRGEAMERAVLAKSGAIARREERKLALVRNHQASIEAGKAAR